MGTGLVDTQADLALQLLGLYITDSAEAISWGLVRLNIICRFYFICGLMDVSTGALRGMGASIEPMIISVLGVCGIRLLWDACVGYRCYGIDERRGGRLFVYHEDAPEIVTTNMVRTLGK